MRLTILDTNPESPEDPVFVAAVALQEHRTENERRLCGDLISEHECAGIINILMSYFPILCSGRIFQATISV